MYRFRVSAFRAVLLGLNGLSTLALVAQSSQDAARAAAMAQRNAAMAKLTNQQQATDASGAPAAVGAKKPGIVRIGLLLPQNGLGQPGDTSAGEAVRDAEAKLLTGPTFEPVKLAAMLPDQALAEAKLLNCDYTLTASLVQAPVPATGRFAKLMNLKNAALASQAAAFIPGVGATAMMGSMLSTAVMQQSMATATRGVKANNNITLTCTLVTITGTVALTDSAKTVSKTNGEDVLPPLLTEEATKVLAAAKPLN